MMKLSVLLLAGVATLALAAPAAAAHRHKQANNFSETGPLIMSGTMVPASAQRSRAPEICKPVVIKRRPIASALIR